MLSPVLWWIETTVRNTLRAVKNTKRNAIHQSTYALNCITPSNHTRVGTSAIGVSCPIRALSHPVGVSSNEE